MPQPVLASLHDGGRSVQKRGPETWSVETGLEPSPSVWNNGCATRQPSTQILLKGLIYIIPHCKPLHCNASSLFGSGTIISNVSAENWWIFSRYSLSSTVDISAVLLTTGSEPL